MKKIAVQLHKDRTLSGILQILDLSGGFILGPFTCLGKADGGDAKLHGNPERNPVLPFGDTPTGKYNVVQLVSHSGGESDLHTYGSFPSVLLDPISGDALKAKKNGRAGLMIHGGGPSASGRLRPTHGCIRLSEANQRDLVSLVVQSVLSEISVVVTEG